MLHHYRVEFAQQFNQTPKMPIMWLIQLVNRSTKSHVLLCEKLNNCKVALKNLMPSFLFTINQSFHYFVHNAICWQSFLSSFHFCMHSMWVFERSCSQRQAETVFQSEKISHSKADWKLKEYTSHQWNNDSPLESFLFLWISEKRFPFSSNGYSSFGRCTGPFCTKKVLICMISVCGHIAGSV